MSLLLPDTSVWIRYLRSGTSERQFRQALRGKRILLASVVAQELYAGAPDRDDRRDLDRIRAAFAAAGLVATPAFDDWCTAGMLLARYSRLRGRVNPRDHLNDILIVLCAAQHRAALLTWNLQDMQRWARMLAPARRVQVTHPQP